jgi:hypothetical protein
MRWFLAGFAALLLMPAFVHAQAKGEVESVGFNNTYRPDSWTPMICRVRPETNEPGTYQLQVWQHDIDGDRPIYTRNITLNGADQAREQRFWMYFLPQSTDKGLPDQYNGGTLKDLQHELQVFLCDAKGKQITELPITSTLDNVDPYRDYAQLPRSAKLILTISDGSDQVAWRDYEIAYGIMEDVKFVNLMPKDLPEDPVGLEGVDAIVWLNADPADLDKGGEHKLAALQDYVRFGGHLVISQPTTDWQKILGFGDMLPVNIQGVGDKDNLEPLRSMAKPRQPDVWRHPVDPWNRPVAPFQFARATTKPSTVVDTWIDWKGDGSYSDATPYIVRSAYGLGAVTWVAQDLGNPAITAKTATSAGWPYIWDKVFGWKNDTYVPPPGVSKDDQDVHPRIAQYETHANPVDLGYPLTANLDETNTAAWLIFVAVAFFLVYWVVAGPGGYFYLASKKRTNFSWFFFGLAALAATALTVLVVKLVLRGPPKIHHLSIVRVAPGQPTLVYSRLGLYIPRDGDQTIHLTDTAQTGVSYVSPYAEHPQQLGDVSEFPAPSDYSVPVRDLAEGDAAELTVPYRSSAKKFQARWIGSLQGGFVPSKLKLESQGSRTVISGTLMNQTGIDFDEVFIAYHGGKRDDDQLIYIPKWNKGTTLDLTKDLTRPATIDVRRQPGGLGALPGDGRVIVDELGNAAVKGGDARERHWSGLWFSHFGGKNIADANIEEPRMNNILPMLSLFDRVPTMWNVPDNANGTGGKFDRVEFFRRGGRMLDVSPSIMAGQLVVLASTPAPLPEPIEINGDKATGKGTVLYQFLLPIDRGDVDKPTTQPSAAAGM